MPLAKLNFAKKTVNFFPPMFELQLVTIWVSIFDQEIIILEQMKKNS